MDSVIIRSRAGWSLKIRIGSFLAHAIPEVRTLWWKSYFFFCQSVDARLHLIDETQSYQISQLVSVTEGPHGLRRRNVAARSYLDIRRAVVTCLASRARHQKWLLALRSRTSWVSPTRIARQSVCLVSMSIVVHTRLPIVQKSSGNGRRMGAIGNWRLTRRQHMQTAHLLYQKLHTASGSHDAVLIL